MVEDLIGQEGFMLDMLFALVAVIWVIGQKVCLLVGVSLTHSPFSD